MNPQQCLEGRQHDWDPTSGYCRYGCGNRDDGRVVTRAGDEIRRPVEPPKWKGYT